MHERSHCTRGPRAKVGEKAQCPQAKTGSSIPRCPYGSQCVHIEGGTPTLPTLAPPLLCFCLPSLANISTCYPHLPMQCPNSQHVIPPPQLLLSPCSFSLGFLSQLKLPQPHENWVNPILTSIFCQVPPKPMLSPVMAGKQL